MGANLNKPSTIDFFLKKSYNIVDGFILKVTTNHFAFLEKKREEHIRRFS